MKVQMIAAFSGSRDSKDWPIAGGILECSDAEGADLIAAGLASAVEKKAAPAVPEKAIAPKPELRGGLNKKNAV